MKRKKDIVLQEMLESQRFLSIVLNAFFSQPKSFLSSIFLNPTLLSIYFQF